MAIESDDNTTNYSSITTNAAKVTQLQGIKTKMESDLNYPSVISEFEKNPNYPMLKNYLQLEGGILYMQEIIAANS